MASRQRNSVRILSSRERGSQTFGSQRLLQLLVEEKVRWMKWQSQVRLPSLAHLNLIEFQRERNIGVTNMINVCVCLCLRQKVELPDSPRSTFLLAFSPDR